MLLLTLITLTLWIGSNAAGDIEPPDAVTNLHAYQEGFDGMISAVWEAPPNFTNPHQDHYDIIAFHDNETLGKWEVISNVTAISVEQPTVGFEYILQVTPFRYDNAEKIFGPSTNASVVFQGRNTLIHSPTNFTYEARSQYNFQLRWQWDDNNTLNNTWFFVQACQIQYNECFHLIAREKTVISPFMSSESIYDVKIFAHAGGPADTNQVQTSEALEESMRTCPSKRPVPQKPEVTPVPALATKDIIPYVVSWSLWPRHNTINVTLEAYTWSDAEGWTLSATNGTNGYGLNVTVDLNYDTHYAFRPFAYYDEGPDGIYKQEGYSEEKTTMRGPSNPVGNLKAKQDGSSNRVIVTWARPRITNGPLLRYDIRVTGENRTELQPGQTVKESSNTASVTIQNAAFGPLYYISVIPIGFTDHPKSEISGQIAVTSIVLKTGGFPGWATALIVVLILAVVAGGAFYYVKRRNQPDFNRILF